MKLKNVKEFVKIWKESIKVEIEENGYKPRLYIVQVGDNEASNRYVRNKIKDCEEVGIEVTLKKYDESISQGDLKREVSWYASEDYCDGIMVQLPLPAHIEAREIEKVIPNYVDVDGVTVDSHYNSCTPLGIMKYLEYCGIDLDGANALVIGRSDIVGKPMARLLTEANATVTMAHSHTKHLYQYINIADIIVCAVGKAGFLNCYPIHVPVIDVGINFNEEGKMVGDCINTENRDVTPVPGGVGLLTRCALLQNVVDASHHKYSR